MEEKKHLKPSDALPNFLLYTTPNIDVKIEIYFQNETVWLSQQKMAELFGVGKAAISKHLANIYESGELQKEATVSKMETVQTEGNRQVTRVIDYYNLDAIISVGYRVNSIEATAFRKWATLILHEYIVKFDGCNSVGVIPFVANVFHQQNSSVRAT